uniref:Uncharacterized protein n=1 Tax=Poecilia latipinna TaxID=48699 RepID=A0A3B3U9V2_9TELE
MQPAAGDEEHRSKREISDQRRSTPGLEGRSTPGLEGRSTPGLQDRSTPGLEGRSTPGLEGRSTPGLEGRSTPGLEGRSTPGLQDRSTPGLQGRSPATFRCVSTSTHLGQIMRSLAALWRTDLHQEEVMKPFHSCVLYLYSVHKEQIYNIRKNCLVLEVGILRNNYCHNYWFGFTDWLVGIIC